MPALGSHIRTIEVVVVVVAGEGTVMAVEGEGAVGEAIKMVVANFMISLVVINQGTITITEAEVAGVWVETSITMELPVMLTTRKLHPNLVRGGAYWFSYVGGKFSVICSSIQDSGGIKKTLLPFFVV